jgi:Putative transposase/Transposase zinc-binding domain
VPRATGTYEPRDSAQSLLYGIVRDHFETFRAQAAALREGEGLPGFVEREFLEFLRCGCLAAGFARFHCDECGHDRLVPFSCKGRGFCPTCGGRRMAERAAQLVDHVLPDVPIRQWVLSLPYRLRYLLAWDHGLCREVVAVCVRAVLGSLRASARRDGVADGRSGAVVIIQRFGGALNLNVHLHALVLDGVFAHGDDGVRFHPTRRLTRDDVGDVVAVVARRIERLLRRRGLAATAEESDAADTWADEAPVLAGLAAASVQGRLALRPRAGARVVRYGSSPEEATPATLGPCHANVGGFDLHAGIVVRPGDRERLERLCRYTLRPPLAQARLRVGAEGQVWLTLRHRWADGTTHLRFDHVALLERLAVLVPRPRINLVLYYGVLGPRAPWRAAVVASAGSEWSDSPSARGRAEFDAESDPHGQSGAPRPGGYLWADLMRRTFGNDVLECPRCGGRLQLMALIEDARVVANPAASRSADRPARSESGARPAAAGRRFRVSMGAAADATF